MPLGGATRTQVVPPSDRIASKNSFNCFNYITYLLLRQILRNLSSQLVEIPIEILNKIFSLKLLNAAGLFLFIAHSYLKQNHHFLTSPARKSILQFIIDDFHADPELPFSPKINMNFPCASFSRQPSLRHQDLPIQNHELRKPIPKFYSCKKGG